MSQRVRPLPYTLDTGDGARARLGVLVLQTDQTLEGELRQLTDLPGVATYHARLPNAAEVTPETLAEMARALPEAAKLIAPELELDAIAYACTSGATVIGEAEVSALLGTAHRGVPSTTPLSAAKAAFTALGARRIALLTPYRVDVTRAMQARFVEAGFDVVEVGTFNEDDDLRVGKIDAKSLRAAVLELGRAPDVDGVFISCTSLRAVGLIDSLEAALGKPVTSSNHALAWHLLRLARIDDRSGPGRLFQLGKEI